MWIPAIAGWDVRAIVRAQAENVSSDEVMSVGRKRVTPVFPIAATASSMRSEVSAGSPKSTPAKPFTCRSKRPGSSTVRFVPATAPSPPCVSPEARPVHGASAAKAPAIPALTMARRVSSGMAPPRAPRAPYRSTTTRGTDAPAESIRLTPSSTDRSVSITSVTGSTTTSPT